MPEISRRKILHVDMDAFYAAIEQLDNPGLRGKPVIVGAPPDKRGVVSTCSYEARPFGVRSAMPSRTAHQLCPHAVFVPVRMERYAAVSEQVMAILQEFTPIVEQVSVDEAFLDVAGVLHAWPDAVMLARALKQRIHSRLRLTASVGVAPNKFLAKLASDMQKPDGLTVVPATEPEILAFLAPLPLTRIWGVGKRTAEQLAAAGITTIGRIQQMTEPELAPLLGQAGARHVWRLARGRDDRQVETDVEEKSVSAEVTFEQDITDRTIMRQTLLELAEKVGRRLRRAKKSAGTARIKIRFRDFRTITRQCPFAAPARSDRDLVHAALSLLAKEKLRDPVRLLGFGVSRLTDTAAGQSGQTQAPLFPEWDSAAPAERHAQLDQAVDTLRERFGKGIIKRGRWQT
ncbi:MAG: DNA polymerase IV [Kiritimatiellae bacterium]|nr:DNA polymerase IV [Kiritimatiellia bacterium]